MVRVSPLANPSVSADLPKAFLHSTSILLPPELPSSNDDDDEDEDEDEEGGGRLRASWWSSSRPTISAWPAAAAQWRGVFPEPFGTSAVAPRDRRSRTTDAWPLAHATWRGVPRDDGSSPAPRTSHDADVEVDVVGRDQTSRMARQASTSPCLAQSCSSARASSAEASPEASFRRAS